MCFVLGTKWNFIHFCMGTQSQWYASVVSIQFQRSVLAIVKHDTQVSILTELSDDIEDQREQSGQ